MIDRSLVVIMYIRFTDIPCDIPTISDNIWNIVNNKFIENNYETSDFQPYALRTRYSRLPKEYNYKFSIEDKDKFRGIGITLEDLDKIKDLIINDPEYKTMEKFISSFDMYF